MATPKTLEEAISNGETDFVTTSQAEREACEKVISMHVRDYLAQKFSGPMLEYDVIGHILATLWERITGEKLK